jgi:hypothetical protein
MLRIITYGALALTLVAGLVTMWALLLFVADLIENNDIAAGIAFFVIGLLTVILWRK